MQRCKDVDGRDKPGHDGEGMALSISIYVLILFLTILLSSAIAMVILAR